MNKIFGMLGLATAAGKIAFGDTAVRDVVFRGKAKLVILATDSGENIKDKIKKICTQKNVLCVEFSDKESIGKAVGKEGKAVVAVTDKGFADAVIKLIDIATNKLKEE